MRDVITVVSGFGRCGSTLMMRLVRAAGIPVVADSMEGGLEYGPALKLPKESEWLKGCIGKAVKILDPQRYTPPAGLPYRFIWLDRDPTQQAKSQIKMLQTIFGAACVRNEPAVLARSMVRDRPTAIAAMQKLSKEVAVFRFEDLIESPVLQCLRLVNWLDVPASGSLLASIIRKRETDCLPYMAELDDLKARAS
jgi:hypothetical protein